MADKIEFYRGYDIALYFRGRDNVFVQIREGSGGLPPIHTVPYQKSVESALETAKGIINLKLASLKSQ